ncbi:hypothetical protein IAU60_004840 [Kwoniella sp. DSM 27419]
MSHPARLSLRAPPHLPFIQGFPGIPSAPDRKPAGVHGTLELRVGTVPVKAKWVRVELRKHESLPPGYPSSGNGKDPHETWEHIGSIQTLWQPGEGKEWDGVETADLKFFIPLPENIPPSVELPRNTGVRYELVAALCYRQKGGLFKKESTPIIKVSEWLLITKHEQHSAWPIYNTPDTRTIQAANGQINLIVSRPNTAFGSGDKLRFTAALKSSRSQPFKLKGFECTLFEIITALPAIDEAGKGKKRKSLNQPVSKSRPITAVKAIVDEIVGLAGEKSARIEMQVDRALVTVRQARSLQVTYELEVKAVMDGVKDKVEMKGIAYTVGPFSRSHAEEAVRDIGYVEALCPGVTRPSSMQSYPSYASGQDSVQSTPPMSNRDSHPYPPTSFSPRDPSAGALQPVQGFVPRDDLRRRSYATSFSSESASTIGPGGDFGVMPAGGGPTARGYQTVPNQQSGGYMRGSVAFPDPRPAPSGVKALSTRSVTPTSPVQPRDDRDGFSQSEMGHGTPPGPVVDNRYSTSTMATFGRWDRGLRAAIDDDAGEGTVLSLAESDKTTTPTSPNGVSASTHPSSPAMTMPSRPTSVRPPVSSTQEYMSAEQEKRVQRELFESARSRAIAAQMANGTSLDQIGLSGPMAGGSKSTGEDEIPDAPPPEYAPPRPEQPKREYTAPARPLSSYTNGSPSLPNSPTVRQAQLGEAQLGESSPPSPVPQSMSSSSNQAFMSAADEKELQRRRYEEATSKIGLPGGHAGGSGSGLDGTTDSTGSPVQNRYPVGLGISSPPPFTPGQSNPGGGLSEKEQMRRYHVARDRVDAASRGEVVSPIAGGSGQQYSAFGQRAASGPPIGSAISASDEKAQMRRYYEAQEKVAAQRGDSTPNRVGARTPMAGSTPSPARSVGPMSALSEKEQMRRYYEARDRVASASSQGREGPNDVAGGSGSASGGASRAEHAALASPSQRGSASEGAGPSLSAAEEKEQMRRYFEAMDRVQRASSQVQSQPTGSMGASSAFANALGQRQLVDSPLNENGPVSYSGEVSENAPPLAPIISASSGPGAGAGSSSGSGSGFGAAAGAGPGLGRNSVQPASYMSAEEEKEAMRRRYEAATSAVGRYSSPPPSQSPHPSSLPATVAPPHGGYRPRTSLGDAGQALLSSEGGVPRPRTSMGTGTSADSDSPWRSVQTSKRDRPISQISTVSNLSTPPDSPLIRDPTVKAGKARARGSEDGHARDSGEDADRGAGSERSDAPPPPLPARPPKEYVQLLSPVGEQSGRRLPF